MIKPELTVAAIAERNGRFLMVEEWVKGKVCFNQPAGHIENGESFEQAVIRETMEESGHAFEPDCIVGSYLWRAQPTDDLILRTVFAGQCSAEAITQDLDDGIIAAHWLTLEEIRGLGSKLRSPLVIQSIQSYQAGCRLPLDAIQNFEAVAGANS